MEILILLVVLVAVSFWVKSTFPDAAISKYIAIIHSYSASLIKKLQPVIAEAIVTARPTSDKSTEEKRVIASHPPGYVVKQSSAYIPEDSVLKRHYLAQLEAERKSITNPYPTDSVLRRHYENMQVN